MKQNEQSRGAGRITQALEVVWLEPNAARPFKKMFADGQLSLGP